MSRRTPTAAQKESSAARREQIKALAKKVSEMSETDRVAMLGGGIASIDGHVYSVHNQCMIVHQLGSGASVVGGFHQWRKAGRCVRKGEAGAGIWICTGETIDEKTGKERPRFMVGYVFDISQTDPINAEAEAVAA